MTDTTTPDALRPIAGTLRARADGCEAGDEIALVMADALHCVAEAMPDADLTVAWKFFWAGAYLDATEALRQAVLPGSRWIHIGHARRSPSEFFAQLRRAGTVGMDDLGDAPAEPAARLAALLRALAAEMEAGNG